MAEYLVAKQKYMELMINYSEAMTEYYISYAKLLKEIDVKSSDLSFWVSTTYLNLFFQYKKSFQYIFLYFFYQKFIVLMLIFNLLLYVYRLFNSKKGNSFFITFFNLFFY